MGADSTALIRGTCDWRVRLDHCFRPSDYFVVIRRNGRLELSTDFAGNLDVEHCGYLRPPSAPHVESTGPVFHGSWPRADVVADYCSDLSVLPGEAVLPLANSMGMDIAR